jgi:hypothetical protein
VFSLRTKEAHDVMASWVDFKWTPRQQSFILSFQMPKQPKIQKLEEVEYILQASSTELLARNFG